MMTDVRGPLLVRKTRWQLPVFSSSVVMMSLLFGLFCLASLGLWIGEAFPAIWSQSEQLIMGTEWFSRAGLYGAAPMIYGSVVVTLIALILAVPVGVGAAVMIAEYLPVSLSRWVKLGIEMLAAVPSVVYGLLGVLILREFMYESLVQFDPISGDSLLTAGVLLGVMILPTICTLSEDALRVVPRAQRQASRGLGMTRSEAVWRVSLPQARGGILTSVLLGLGRAMGETIAVFLVVGRMDNQMPSSWASLDLWIEPGQTLTSKLGGPETHLSMGDPVHWGAILSLGLVLLVLTSLVIVLTSFFRRSG